MPRKTKVKLYDVYELTLAGPTRGNPFVEVELRAVFRCLNRELVVFGFYDGGDYHIRFMPDRMGAWSYTVYSNCMPLDGQTGSFECVGPELHGPVRVRNRFHFAYADGTRYTPVGTTCYAWSHQGAALKAQTLRTLRQSPFNKLRMCVFPKHYDFNHNEPEIYPFEGSPEKGWDFERFNPAFFRHLERNVAALRAQGIEADLILFHPYDRWGFADMGAAADDRYLKYVVARLSAYSNVWWSLANEYDLMASKRMSDWDRFFQIIQEYDPYQHLRSIHNCRDFYDYGKPWVTHCSIQHADLSRVGEWRETYGKPVVVDECGYEGNLSHEWGNLTPQEMTARFWEGFVRGGYVGHGETYDRGDELLWWSKGGGLHGKSPERIAFLKGILDKAPRDMDPVRPGKDAKSAGGAGDGYFLVNCRGQPAYKDIVLPEGVSYQIDILDTWNMTVRPCPGRYSGSCRIPLPGKPYMVIQAVKAAGPSSTQPAQEG